MKYMAGNPYMRRAAVLVGSKKFFGAVVALLVLQAAWIAASGRYPMAFDEAFHLGIIRLYANHISPFWSHQPAGGDVFGAVYRDPSYLYQYLMSFPYRLISALTADQTLQVLALRAVNIGLFAWGLTVYRKLMLKTGASRAMVQGCLLIFVLVPVVPLLAAQINYDNLFFPLVGLALLRTVELQSILSRQRKLDGQRLLKLLILCLMASLVKYAFLPIFVAVVLYITLLCLRTFKGWRGSWNGLAAAIRRLGLRSGMLFGALLVLSGLLFAQRYVVNAVSYHNPVPACEKVLSDRSCMAYGPWARDHKYALTKTAGMNNTGSFAANWLWGMWFRTFFAVAGPATDYQTQGPLLLPAVGSIIFAAAGLVLMAAYGRQVAFRYNARVLGLLMLTALAYIAALWLDNFSAYLRTGQPVAINGRYLFPVLPPLLLMAALSAEEFCRGRSSWIKPALAGAAVICLLWGGGALTYVLRSSDGWYWPGARPVNDVNHAVQNTLGPVIPGYRNPAEFMGSHGT